MSIKFHLNHTAFDTSCNLSANLCFKAEQKSIISKYLENFKTYENPPTLLVSYFCYIPVTYKKTEIGL